MTKDTAHAGEQTLHHIYIEASSIIQHKDSESMGGNMLNFTNKDYYMIKVSKWNIIQCSREIGCSIMIKDPLINNFRKFTILRICFVF